MMVLYDAMRNLLDAHAMLEATDELLQEHEDQRLAVLVREALLATEKCVRESGRNLAELPAVHVALEREPGFKEGSSRN